MATLVSSATLSPLTGIDALEFSLDDLAHLLRIVGGNTSSEIGERRRGFLDRHRKRDFTAIGQSLGPLQWAKHSILEDGLESFFHRHDRSRVSLNLGRFTWRRTRQDRASLRHLILRNAWARQGSASPLTRP
jgi:hypothetical protein